MKCHGTNGGWEKYEGNPVLGGNLGTCFDISVLAEDNCIEMYFSWRDRKSVAMVKSTDGIHWNDPVVVISPIKTKKGWEDDINRPSVLRKDGLYYLWYTGQYKAGEKDGKSYIFLATGNDGIRFRRFGTDPVLEPEKEWEKNAVMCPSVIWDEDIGKFVLWYSGGEQYEPNAIGYAESDDGVHWKKYDMNPIFKADAGSEWERHKTAGCQVFKYDGFYYMFYIGYYNEDYAQIGIARSKNGRDNWERSSLNPIIAPDEGKFDSEACYKPFVIHYHGRWMLWYNGRTGRKEQVGLAVNKSRSFVF